MTPIVPRYAKCFTFEQLEGCVDCVTDPARALGKESPRVVEIAFQTRELRDICEKEANAVDALGMDTAGALKRRLADLRAANSIEDLVVGKPTALHGPGEGRMSISLTENYRLVLSANHRHHPLTEDGYVNWPQVRRVKVERIERLHV